MLRRNIRPSDESMGRGGGQGVLTGSEPDFTHYVLCNPHTRQFNVFI